MVHEFGIKTIWAFIKACFLGKIIFALIPVIWYTNHKFFRRGNAYLYLSIAFFILHLLEPVNPTERYFFPCYFFLIFYIVRSLSQYDIKHRYLFALLVLALLDSKVDKGIKRVFNNAKLYTSGKTSWQIVNKASALSNFWNFVAENTLIISDRSSEIYYAPKGVRLHQYSANWDAEFLVPCTDKDIVKLKPYSYAILAMDIKNPCYSQIKNKGKNLKTIDQYTLYDIRGISDGAN